MPVKKSEMGIGRVITMGGSGLGVRGVKVASKRNRCRVFRHPQTDSRKCLERERLVRVLLLGVFRLEWTKRMEPTSSPFVS